MIASHNQGKIKEFHEVLGDRWRITPQGELGVSEAAETGLTFVENALLKARHACIATGCASLADDSGLVVPALGGEPGLRSARYSSEGDKGNNALLLANMASLTGHHRTAFYVAVVVLLRHAEDPTPVIAEGRWFGKIAEAPRGEGGFGYDPLFIPEGSEIHAAELCPQEKNAVSHRAQAVSNLIQQLQA